MGDAKIKPSSPSFNSQLRVEFHGAIATSDAGLLLPRELDERLDLNTLIEGHHRGGTAGTQSPRAANNDCR